MGDNNHDHVGPSLSFESVEQPQAQEWTILTDSEMHIERLEKRLKAFHRSKLDGATNHDDLTSFLLEQGR
jgi:hypothetical protein